MYTLIDLDRPRRLRYGLKALALAERQLGRPLSRVDWDALTVDEVVALLWAGLVHEDPGLTPEDLLDALDGAGRTLADTVAAMVRALEEALGTGGEGNGATAGG